MARNQPTPLDDSGGTLDDLLAEASSLAGELSRELGGLEADLALDEFRVADTSTDPVTDLDAEIAKLVELQGESPVASDAPEASSGVDMSLLDVFETGDDKPSTATESPSPPDSDASGDANDEAIPDFMREFTEAPRADDATEASTGSPAAATSAQGARLGVVGTGTPGVVGTGGIGVVGKPTDPPPTADAADAEGEFGPAAGDNAPARQPGRVRAMADRAVAMVSTRAAPVGLRLGELGVRVLEVADRPFSRIGGTLRAITGWMAIATCGTAMIAYIVSLF